MELADSPSTSPSRKDIIQMKNEIGPRYIIFMVGLPARGKSYICKKLCKYLVWSGFNTKIFNVGNKRRKDAAVSMTRTSLTANSSSSGTSHNSSFFDANNAEATQIREKLAADTLEELIEWLNVGGGKVAIHDATNSTLLRRKTLSERVAREKGIKGVFIESICSDPDLLEQNIKMKLQGPDYKTMDPEMAMADFKDRIVNYEKVYQTISEEEEKDNMSFIKIIDVGRKVVAHLVTGYLPSQCVFYLMQMNISKRTIWLTRHGESEFNVLGKIGGDSPLTDAGRAYAKCLNEFIQQYDTGRTNNSATKSFEQLVDSRLDLSKPKLRVFTSTLARAVQTAEAFDPDYYEVACIRFLNEIYSGSFDGMSYEDIQRQFPEEFEARQKNRLYYRFPGAGGESYADVIERLKPIIIELERMKVDMMVVSHNVTMRTLLAYFTGIAPELIPRIKVPLHSLYCLEPKPYGADLKRFGYNSQTNTMEYVGEGVEMI